MLKKILIGAVALIAVFLVVVGMQPSEYRVERTTMINAPAEAVWAEFSDFSHWKNWSHWEKSDPSQKTTITGEPGTVGHKTVWSGEKTGKGSMTITEATKPTSANIKLVFDEPMASEATTQMTVEAKGEAVAVTWSMDGKNDFMGKFFGLVMGMEDMIGQAYEDSLVNLKQIAEENAKKAKADAEAAAAAAAAEPEADPAGEPVAADAPAP